MELRLETAARQSILGNIYVGQVENIASNIQAAFVLIAPGVRGYFPLQGSRAGYLCLRESTWQSLASG